MSFWVSRGFVCHQRRLFLDLIFLGFSILGLGLFSFRFDLLLIGFVFFLRLLSFLGLLLLLEPFDPFLLPSLLSFPHVTFHSHA